MRGQRPALALAVVALLVVAAPATAQQGAAISVRYRTAETVYLDAGRGAGLAEGERLEVVRGGEVVATLEIVFLAEHSASARVVAASGEVRAGDPVRRLPGAPPPPEVARPQPVPAEEPAAVGLRPAGPAPARRPATRIFGTLAFDWEGFADGGPAGRDWQRRSLDLRLAGRDLGGLPLGLRIRLRASEVERERAYLSGRVPDRESRDRFHELALSWEPAAGRWAVRAGRLGSSPFAGIGYLDGALGEVRFGSVAAGAFAGRRPVIEELGFEGDGGKVGAYLRLAPPAGADAPGRWQLTVGGLREENDAGDFRDLLTVESSWDGGRWSFAEYARWQLDGDLPGPGGLPNEEVSGLVDLALLARLRLAGGGGVTLSYDRLEPRPELDAPPLGPEQLFVQRLRQGLRLGWDGGRGAGWRWDAAVGMRRSEEAGEGSEDALSLRLAARHPRLIGGLSLAVSAIGFSARDTDGVLLSLQTGRQLARGHELALAVGATGYRGILREERVTGWVRLSGWAELPLGLFARGEAELAGGDDYEGLRLGIGLGYRL